VCRVTQRRYAAKPSVAGDARRLTQQQLLEWELPGLVDDAALLVSEVVTNAVVHARSDIDFTLAVAEGSLEVGVADRETRRPRVRPTDPGLQPDEWAWLSTHGRGMVLVDQIADEWGVEELATGKQIWFRLAAPTNWPYTPACVCRDDDSQTVRLGSGRRAVVVSPT
jgi:anti-sigma regulatory factor (Ser/Thr protein kinase)